MIKRPIRNIIVEIVTYLVLLAVFVQSPSHPLYSLHCDSSFLIHYLHHTVQMPSLAQAPDAEGHNAAGAPPKLSNSLQHLQLVESHIPTQAKTADQEAEAEGFEQLRVLLDDLIPNDCMDLLETPNTSSQMTGPNLKKILPTDWLTSKLAANAAYSKQPKDRPNTTYTVLISLAMYSSGTGKATVKAIYEFIA